MDEQGYPRSKIFKRRPRNPEANNNNDDQKTSNAHVLSFGSQRPEAHIEPTTTTTEQHQHELIKHEHDVSEITSQELLQMIMETDGILSLDKDSIVADDIEEEKIEKEMIISQSPSVSSLSPHHVESPFSTTTVLSSAPLSASRAEQQQQQQQKSSKVSIAKLLAATVAMTILACYYCYDVGYIQLPTNWLTDTTLTSLMDKGVYLWQDWMEGCHAAMEEGTQYARRYVENIALVLDDMAVELIVLWLDWRYRLALWILPSSSSFPSSLCECPPHSSSSSS
ncbi:hypothetical protein BDB00DRAFT_158621 [Zychaea mexicana]|uniref:uncharacterized protein n=1 Tax=Zychaea mexicana TaxID=64656 RepID=UPI0022FF2BBE|nr:uncharacterized protein BDB00DRAFT_158621 [Zychaea mexicana]KAI9482622.1 hypothetical protein BDB00DRAFT_158621 [Zychaea mexicana]